jgi:hypothetical protein
MTNKLPFRIQVIQHDVGVALVTGCEHDDLALLRELPQEIDGIWADIDSSIDLLSSGKFDFEGYIVRLTQILVAVDEGFVQIEDDGVFDFVKGVIHLEGGRAMECFSISLWEGLRLFWRYLSVCSDCRRCSLKGSRKDLVRLSMAFSI